MEAARAQNSSAVVSVAPAAPSSPAVNTATSSSPPASDLRSVYVRSIMPSKSGMQPMNLLLIRRTVGQQ